MVAKVTARQIKNARLARGESQTEFAARFYVDQSTVQRWETHSPPRRGPALIELRRLIDEKVAEKVA